jgi:hypothetical protein
MSNATGTTRSTSNTRAPRPTRTIWVLVIAVLTSGALSAAHAASPTTSHSDVISFADASAVPGGASILVRGAGHVATILTTSDLAPLSPYTMWWVVFNEPSSCTGGVCDTDDLFFSDGTMNVNQAARISILYGDGLLTDASGGGSFSAVLFVGGALGEVVLGEGLLDASAAEIHLVVRAHGALASHLGQAFVQLNTFEPHPLLGGTCVTCRDEQFAVHPAAVRLTTHLPADMPAIASVEGQRARADEARRQAIATASATR